jgi:hypothetical protein
VTYNFDPERWLEMNTLAVRARAAAGELSEKELAAALAELEQRYEEMLARLDGSFRIPGSR